MNDYPWVSLFEFFPECDKKIIVRFLEDDGTVSFRKGHCAAIFNSAHLRIKEYNSLLDEEAKRSLYKELINHTSFSDDTSGRLPTDRIVFWAYLSPVDSWKTLEEEVPECWYFENYAEQNLSVLQRNALNEQEFPERQLFLDIIVEDEYGKDSFLTGVCLTFNSSVFPLIRDYNNKGGNANYPILQTLKDNIYFRETGRQQDFSIRYIKAWRYRY